jgi:hypothetical protein
MGQCLAGIKMSNLGDALLYSAADPTAAVSVSATAGG